MLSPNPMMLVLALLLGSSAVAAQTDGSEVDRLTRFKGVFVYNFIDYVKWPEPDGVGPFVIGVLGEHEVTATLQQIAQKRKAGDRTIVVRSFPPDRDSLPACDILFLSASVDERLAELWGLLEGKQILTVSDTAGFAQKGVAVNFVVKAGKLKFEINTRALAHADLDMSSQLLKLAMLVE